MFSFTFVAVGDEDAASVNKLVEMTEERTTALVPMETTAISVAQQQLMQVQQNGPAAVNEEVGLNEEDNSSEDDS